MVNGVLKMNITLVKSTFISLGVFVMSLVPGCGTPSHALISTFSKTAASTTSSLKPIADLIHTAKQPHPDTSQTLPNPTLHSVSTPVLQTGDSRMSAEWLNEALATLHYLPVQFTAVVSPNEIVKPNSPPPQTAIQLSTALALAAKLQTPSLTPLPGTWAWAAAYPDSLVKLWDPHAFSIITEGAVMSFERQNGLVVDGIAGPMVFTGLLKTLNANTLDAHLYKYVTVTKTTPERMDIWQDGKVIDSSLANTGIAASPTPTGTWPVYLRLPSQTMNGKNPNGQAYSDANVPWINYFNQGDAIHGFYRPSYGTPQSLGCVELPGTAAKAAYQLLHYGTLVTVI